LPLHPRAFGRYLDLDRGPKAHRLAGRRRLRINHQSGILDDHGGQGGIAHASARGIAQLHLKTLVRVVHPIVQNDHRDFLEGFIPLKAQGPLGRLVVRPRQRRPVHRHIVDGHGLISVIPPVDSKKDRTDVFNGEINSGGEVRSGVVVGNPNVDGDPGTEQCALAGIAQGDPHKPRILPPYRR
jgi:hypothetical protein